MNNYEEKGDFLKYLRKTMRIMGLSQFLIVISTAMAFSSNSYSQNTKLTLDLNNATVKVVSGTVIDQSGQPLPGVTVVVKGTTEGAITNADGEYSLVNIPEDATLVFSFVGMKTQEVAVGNQTRIDVRMEEETIGLEEVVAIGYGTQKKANLTGAISTVSSEVFENRAVTTASQALQGQIANLNIVNNSGGPGAKASFNIRGYSGLNASYSPLIIIDGVTGSFDDINPNDIETLTVLKDAASSAIYGAQAAYGVILITTKNGKRNQAPVITYTNNFSVNSPTVLPKTAGSLEFAKLFREASLNEGGGGIIDLETIDRIEQYYNDPGSIPNNVANEAIDDWGSWNDGLSNANTDWFKVLFKPQLSQMHNIQLRGGGERSAYMMSIGNNFDGGKLRHYDDYSNRTNISAKISSDVNKWLTIGMNVRYAREKTIQPSYAFDQDGGASASIGWVSQIWPTQPEYNPDGGLFKHSRLPAIAQANPNSNITDNIWGTGTALIKISPSIKLNLDFTGNKFIRKHTYSRGMIYYMRPSGNIETDGTQEETQVWQKSHNDDYFTSNQYITYEKPIRRHFLKLTAGSQQELKQSHYLYMSKKNLVIPNKPSISTATGYLEADDNLDHWTTLGFFGRLNYNYKEKYLFEAVLRRDGSSRYADKSIISGYDGKWGTFPSLSIAWNIAKEDFFASTANYFSELKMRINWGELGNMRGKSYQYVSTINYRSPFPYIMDNSLISSFQSPTIIAYNTWEKNRTLDLGLDFTSFNGRLNGSFDWYRKDIIGLITRGEVLPSVLGDTSPETNNADIRNTGFELSLSWRSRFSLSNKPFLYRISATLSDYQGTVLKFSNPNGIISDFNEGRKMGEIWGFTTDHIMVNPEEAAAMNESGAQAYFGSNWTQGDMKYKDLNGDGIINEGSRTLTDHGDLSVIGNTTPRYNYGIGVDAEWYNLDFSIFFQGVGKRDVWLYGVLSKGLGGGQWGSNVWKNTLDAWRNDESNLDPFWPKFYLSDGGSKNIRTQTKYLDNAAYCRLKNLQIGYSLPNSIIARTFLEKVRIYFSGENLMTFTKMNENIEPEAPVDNTWGRGLYPLTRSVSAGVNVTF